MEFKDYLKIIKREKSPVIALTLLIGLAALIFTAIRPTVYDTSLSLSVVQTTSQQTEDYKYDQYYTIQAAEFFANTIEQWLKSPEVVVSIFQKAGVNLPIENLRKLTNKFKADKMASQYVEVRFKARNKPEADRISTSTISVLQDKIRLLNQADQVPAFSVVGAQPVIVENKPNVLLNTVLGLIVGLFIGISLAFFKEYFTDKD